VTTTLCSITRSSSDNHEQPAAKRFRDVPSNVLSSRPCESCAAHR
jgi:hypothetical protein